MGLAAAPQPLRPSSRPATPYIRGTCPADFDHEGAPEADAPVSLSYRFSMGSRSITYTGDTGPSTGVTLLAKDSDMVSEVIDFEALFAQLQRVRKDARPAMLTMLRKHLITHHLQAADVGNLAVDARVGCVVLTHLAIPGDLSASEPSLREGVRKLFQGPVLVARDQSTYDVDCR